MSHLKINKTIRNGLKSIRGSCADQLGSISGVIDKAKFKPFWGRFWPSLSPPANSVNFSWSQMACTGVPQIVLHILLTDGQTNEGIPRPLCLFSILYLSKYHSQAGWTSHLPIWGPLDGSKAKFRQFWGRFWPSLTPPANSVNSNGPKWLVQVSHK